MVLGQGVLWDGAGAGGAVGTALCAGRCWGDEQIGAGLVLPSEKLGHRPLHQLPVKPTLLWLEGQE